MFKSFSLKFKLIALCSVLAMMTGVLGAVNFFTTRDVLKNYRHIVNVNLKNVETLGEMRVAFKQVRLRAFRAGIEGLDSANLRELSQDISEAIEQYETADKIYMEIDFQPGEDVLYAEVDKYWDEQKGFLSDLQKAMDSGSADSHQKIVEILKGRFVILSKSFDPAMDKLTKFHEAQAAKWTSFAKDEHERAEYLSMAIGFGTMFIGFLVGLLFSRNLSMVLGDLAKRLATEAGSVATAANQISEASVESSSALTQQAAALQQTVAAIDEISAMVGKNAENAGRSLEVSSTCQVAASRGKNAVDQMLASIDEIGRSNKDIMVQTEASNQEISSIVKIISEIGNKTAVINDIVFQTKLLSFNASVEAARAGEHGKGFAVVAEEVGNLAQMSGNAAKEIAQMLEASIAKVERTVLDTKSKLESMVTTGRAKIEAGASTARSCGDALDDIVRQVSDLNAIVSEISTASREQAQGVQEISKALGQIDQGMQQNTSVAAQSAAASEDLTNQAHNLDGIVSSLVRTVSGDHETVVRQPVKPAPAAAKPSADKKKTGVMVKFPEKKAPIVIASNTRQKRAVGAEEIPADDDPRFEDI